MMRTPLPAGLLLALCAAACSPASGPSPGPGPEGRGFVDRTAHAGFTFENHTGKKTAKDFIVEAKGGGALVLDYDGDGDLDLYVIDGNTYRVDERGVVRSRTTTPGAHNRLLRNDGNWRFTDVTEAAGVGDRSYGFGGGVGDFDNDGRPDIFVCNWGRNVLYRNNGDGTFTDVTDRAGVGGRDSHYSTGATFFDADGDGDLDLYVANYNDMGAYIRRCRGKGRTARWRGIMVYAGPKGIPPQPDEFYRNNGDGTFTDETRTALVDQEPRYAFTAVPGDYDNDGDLDLYVSCDTLRNALWVNDGTGRFRDRGARSGADVDAQMCMQAGMGVDAADYNRDGWLDLFVTNFSHDKNTLYRNRTAQAGSLFFEDVSVAAGLGSLDFYKTCWGTKFEDFDHDGNLDIFVTAGHVYPEVDRFPERVGTTYRQLPSLWISEGPPAWRFHRLEGKAAGPGLAVPKVGRGSCFADFDDDGDIDVFIVALNERPLLLENRLEKRGHWFMLDLVGGEGEDRDAIGVRVTVTAGEIRQMRERKRSASFISANDPRLHWGLGPHDKVDRLEIRWRNGDTEVHEDLPADHLYRAVHGKGIERVR